MADGAHGPITEAHMLLRRLPSVQSLLEHPSAADALDALGHAALIHGLRDELSSLRAAILTGQAGQLPDAARIVAAAIAACREPATLRRVINATGIVVHTNLGRAPLAEAAAAAAAEAARSACNLEFDLQTGCRGPRGAGAEALLCRLTGAEAALAVNNNAAAMLLALSALAGPGAEVVVSRGELVEIGGGFRIPDIITQGGARLVEVGTTNRTRLADYEAAITPQTRLLLKVHQSNFRMVGFTAEASLAELAGLARARGLKLLDDLGSGTLAHLPGHLAQLEPTVRESLDAGTDLVAFSGDKLLGGPQCGLLAGRAELVDRLRRHPLMRALRLDKMTLAALEATLRLHADPVRAAAEIPVLRMLGQSEAELAARAEHLCALLGAVCTADAVASTGHAGGGALPGQNVASRAVRLAAPGCSPDTLAHALRAQTPAVVGRIHGGCLLLDMLTVPDAELAELAAAVRAAMADAAPRQHPE